MKTKNKIFCLVFFAALVSLEIMELNSTCSIFKGILGHYSLGVLGMFFVAKERLPKVLFLFSVLTVFSFGANSTFASSSEVARGLFDGKETYHDYNTWGKNGHDNASLRNGYYGGHSGIDIQTTTKSTDDIFYSVSGGKVIKAGGDNYNGIYIYDEDRDVTAIYLHASKVSVSNGQTVSVGQPLGNQGSTGRVTGIHVHLEFRYGKQTTPATGKGTGTTIDPVATAMSYIKAQTLPPEKPSLPSYRDGILLKGSKPEVYVIQGGKKYLIPDPATFKHMGFSWNAIRKIPDEALQQIPNGQTLPSVKTQESKLPMPQINEGKQEINTTKVLQQIGDEKKENVNRKRMEEEMRMQDLRRISDKINELTKEMMQQKLEYLPGTTGKTAAFVGGFGTKEYDRYFDKATYLRGLVLQLLGDAHKSVKAGNVEDARSYYNRAVQSLKEFNMIVSASTTEWENYLKRAQKIAKDVMEVADISLLTLSKLVPGATPIVKTFLMSRDFVFDWKLYGLDAATGNAIGTVVVSILFDRFVPSGKPIEGLGEIDISTLAKRLNEDSSFRNSIIQAVIKTLPKEIGEEIVKEITNKISDKFVKYLETSLLPAKTMELAEERKRLEEEKKKKELETRYVGIVTRAYKDILKREPDPGGLQYHVNQMKNGMNELQLRQVFLSSQEYKERFAYPDTVRKLYASILKQQPNQDRLTYYVDRMKGGWSEQQVRGDIEGLRNTAIAEQERKELAEKTKREDQLKKELADKQKPEEERKKLELEKNKELETRYVGIVTRAYKDILKREPDPGGLQYHVNQMKNGMNELQLRQVFLSSQEYKERFVYPDTVRKLYTSILRQQPDQDRITYYVDRMKGGWSEQQVRDDIEGLRNTAIAEQERKELAERQKQEDLKRKAEQIREAERQTTEQKESAGRLAEQNRLEEEKQKELETRYVGIVTKTYKDILKREPDPGGLQYHVNQMKNGMNELQLRQVFLSSQEYKERFAYPDTVRKLYASILKQQPNQDRLTYYVERMKGGWSEQQVRGDIEGLRNTAIAEQERKELAEKTKREDQLKMELADKQKAAEERKRLELEKKKELETRYVGIVTKTYKDILKRAPDPDGLQYHVNQMKNGMNELQLRQVFLSSQEYKERFAYPDTVRKLYTSILKQQPNQDRLTYYVERMKGGWSEQQVRGDLEGLRNTAIAEQERKELAEKTKREDQLKMELETRYVGIVTRAYKDILKRDPDQGGLQTYVDLMKKGWSEQKVRNTLLDSQEYKQLLSKKNNTIQVGATVTVTNTGGIGLRLRSSPGLKDSNPTIANLPDGTRMKVMGGPVQADGYTWWRLQGNPGTGWSVGNWLVP